MSSNHHTPYTFHAALKAAVMNVPLGQLDQTITDMLDGSQEFSGLKVGAGALNASAALEIDSTTKGFLPPRMTSAQRDAISSPAEGLLIHNTTAGVLSRFNGSAWGNYDGGVAALVEIVATVSFNTSSLLIDNIDQGYHDLILRVSLVSSGALGRVLRVRPNDVATGYAWQQTILPIGGSTLIHTTDNSDTEIEIADIPATAAAARAELVICFNNYAATGIKLFGSWVGTVRASGGGNFSFGRGAFEDANLAAISSIRLLPSADNIVGSYALYGLGTPE